MGEERSEAGKMRERCEKDRTEGQGGQGGRYLSGSLLDSPRGDERVGKKCLRRGGRSVGVFGKDRLPVLAELGNKTLGAWLRLS